MMMIEARQAERVRSFLRARIVFNNQNSTIDCTIKNISATGAKIDIANTVSVPNTFDLEVPQRGRVYRARLCWRGEAALGVEFLDEDAGSHDEWRLRVERLERENNALRATVTQLTRRLEDLGQAADCAL